MKFKLVGPDARDFTHLVGYITLTRRELIQIFGQPRDEVSSDNKVTTEWTLKFADKTIANIYDYKRYELGAPSDDEVYEWHVGGYRIESLERVVDEIEDFRQRNAVAI
jgi:hypothetical protein